jgi:DNA polymerase-3 subunit gamma/tau
VAAQSSAAVTELDAASNGLVGDIRKLTEMVSYDIGVPYRVIILDEAHAMSREGFNALLKTLEEPPPDTSFILVTTERSKIPGTVASRCDPYLFRRLTTAAIAGRLRQILESESASVEEALLTEIAVRADGAMRDAVMLLQQTVQAGMTTVEGFAKLHGIRDYAPALLTACAMGRHADMFAQVDKVLGETGDALEVAGQLVHCLRDVLVLHAGGTLAASAATLSARQRLAALLSVKSATAALRVLWDLQTRARVSDPRAALELVMVMCGEVLGAGQRPAPPSRVNGHSGVATVAELREFAVA